MRLDTPDHLQISFDLASKGKLEDRRRTPGSFTSKLRWIIKVATEFREIVFKI